jgi:hypothetical protein
MGHCIEIQERIALGEPLLDSEHRHLSSCERCSFVAETYSQLDASLESLAEPVPDGFAERVMSRLAAPKEAYAPRWFESRWFELGLANVALVCALVNAVRFLAGILIPSVSLGVTP